ncbi:prenyltransferase [Corynebacterium pacaense]|uniref:prenyltransferase n=1 Tax=Corynebacterium pacaense TaxID=1816684 RepID=UPI001FE78647|nr:prenyltransferase [Corynebacterium pacaense]
MAVVLSSSRPISWVNTAFPFGLAYLLSGRGVDWLFILGVLFFLIPYNIAMYGINDVFDYESDIRNPRKGGVEGAVVDRRHHSALLWASALTTIPFLVVLFAAGTWASAAWLALSVAAVVAYSAPGLRFKERPGLDAVTSSIHFSSPALVGATIAGHSPTAEFWVGVCAFLLWGMASQILGAVQDVRADREADLDSIATVLGARRATRLATVLYAAAAALVFVLPAPAWIVGTVSLAYVVNAARLWKVTDATCEKAHSAWVGFLVLNYITGAVVSMTLISVFLLPR